MKLRSFLSLAGLLTFGMIVNEGTGALVGGYESPSPPALYSAPRQADTAVNEIDGATTTETTSEEEEGSSEESPTPGSVGGYEDSVEAKEETLTRAVDQLSVENAQSYNYKSPRPQDPVSLYQSPRDQGWSTEKSDMIKMGYDSPSTGINFSNNQFYLPPMSNPQSPSPNPKIRKDDNMMERKQGLLPQSMNKVGSEMKYYENPSRATQKVEMSHSTPVSVLQADLEREYHDQPTRMQNSPLMAQGGYSYQTPNVIQPQAYQEYQRPQERLHQGEIGQMEQIHHFRPQPSQGSQEHSQEQYQQQAPQPPQPSVEYGRQREDIEQRVMSWQQGFSPRMSLFHQSDVSFPQDQEDDSEFEGLNSNIVDAELLARVQKIIEDHEREEMRLLEEQRRNSVQRTEKEGPEDKGNNYENNHQHYTQKSTSDGYPGNENRFVSYNTNNVVEGREENGRALDTQFDGREKNHPQIHQGYERIGQHQNSPQSIDARNEDHLQNNNFEFQRENPGNPNVIYQQAILSSHFVDSQPRRGNNEIYHQRPEPEQYMGERYANQQEQNVPQYVQNPQQIQNSPQIQNPQQIQTPQQNGHIQQTVPNVQYGISPEQEPNNFFYPQRTQVRFTPLDAKMMILNGGRNFYQMPHQNVQVSYQYGVQDNSNFPIQGRQDEQQSYSRQPNEPESFRPSPRDERFDHPQMRGFESPIVMNGYLPPSPSNEEPIEGNSYPKYETKTIVIHEQPYAYEGSNPEPKDTSVTISVGRDEYPRYEQFRETHQNSQNNKNNQNNQNAQFGSPNVEMNQGPSGGSNVYGAPMIIGNTGNFERVNEEERRFYPSGSFSSNDRGREETKQNDNPGRYLPPTGEGPKELKQEDHNRLDISSQPSLDNENNRPMEMYGTGRDNNGRYDVRRNDNDEIPSNVVALPVHEYMAPHQQLMKRFSNNNFYSYRVK